MKNVENRKLMSRLFTLVLACMLVAGSVVSVMAATETNLAAQSDGTNDVQISLTKNYMVPSGVSLPAANFGFCFTKDGIVTGASKVDSTLSADSTQPDLELNGSNDIAYCGTETDLVTDDGKDVYVKLSENILPKGSDFSHAGEYVYTVTEAQGTNTDLDDAMTYSKAEYKLHVFVKNNNGSMLISGASVYQTKDNEGNTGTNGKVDLDDNNSTLGDGNAFAFDNLYAPEDEVLSISKTVTGDYADMTKAFTMKVTLNKPTTYDGTSFTGVIVDEDKKPVDASLLTFTNATPTEITMKTSQKLVFVKSDTTLATSTAIADDDMECMPAGLSYSVVESGETDYEPTAVVTHGGVEDGQLTGTAGQSFTVNTNTIVDLGSNITAMKSEYHSITPTGLIVRILPAVIMVLIAAAAFVILMKSRREEA